MLYPSLLLLHVYSHSHSGSTPCSSDCSVSIHSLALNATPWPIAQSPFPPGSESCSAETPDLPLLVKRHLKMAVNVVYASVWVCESFLTQAMWQICFYVCMRCVRVCVHLLSCPRGKHHDTATAAAEPAVISIILISQVSCWAVSQHKEDHRWPDDGLFVTPWSIKVSRDIDVLTTSCPYSRWAVHIPATTLYSSSS